MQRIIITICLLITLNISFLFSKYPNDSTIVVLVSLDGFRWDYPDRGYCPKLLSIADVGVRASSLKPQFPSMTFPNHYSIITGLVPEKHGIIANFFRNRFNESQFSLKQPDVAGAQWFRGEAFWETARRNGIKTASFFWPGSEMDLEYRRPDYYHKYQHDLAYETRVRGVLDWLALPEKDRPRFITLYFDETDSKAHKFGTNSDGLNQGIKRVDDMIAMLDSGIVSLDLSNRVNLIVLSDHGMTDMSPNRVININKIIPPFLKDKSITTLSTMVFINTEQNDLENVYKYIKSKELGFIAYLKNEIPDRYRYKNHPFIGDIVLIADNGWIFNKNGAWSDSYVATHGYDDKFMDMHGIFFAKGPNFKKNYHSSMLNNLDIYPLLCYIFNIHPAGNIDGDLMNIIHLLNE